MPTINQLSAVDQINDGDQFPLYSPNAGDARKASFTTVKESLADDFASLADLAAQTGAGLVGTSNGTTVQQALDSKPTATLDTDGTLAANSDGRVASQKATKTYADAKSTALAASNGSSLVGFLQSGGGAVATTVQAELRALGARAEQFNAAGTGAGDDSAELQAMLDSGAKKVILTNGKTYRITTGLVVPADVWIEGNGATILSAMTAGSTTAIDFVDGGGARNLKVVGPDGTTYVGENNGIGCTGTNNSPAAPTYVTAPTLENVEVSGFGDYGIRFQYAIDAVSTNINVHDCGRVGVAGLSCEDVWIHGYHCSDIGPGTGGDAYGVFFDRLETGNETVEPRSYRCGVVGFDIRAVNATGGNGQGIDSHGGVDILFADGVITNCDVGGAFTSSSIGGAPALGPIRCRAKSVTINGDHAGYGFFVVGALSGGSIVQYAIDCELDLNLTGHGNDSVSVTDGSISATLFRGTKGLRVSGSFKENESACIYLDRDNYAFNIQGIFTDPHSDNFAAPSCVRVAGNNNGGYVAGAFRYEVAGLGTYVAVNAVRIESGLTGLDLDFGPSTFNGIDATHLAFTALTTTGVRYAGMMRQAGSSTIAVANTGVDGITDVTFSKRFPYAPKITPILRYPFNQGGKFPILGIDSSVVPTATGFRIYAKPADNTTWTATGSLSFDWIAE